MNPCASSTRKFCNFPRFCSKLARLGCSLPSENFKSVCIWSSNALLENFSLFSNIFDSSARLLAKEFSSKAILQAVCMRNLRIACSNSQVLGDSEK